MILELHVADAIHTEAWYHYAVGSVVTLVAIMIAFVFALKCFT